MRLWRQGEGLSLKVRLWLVFSALMFLAIAFSAVFVYQQHRIAVRSAELALSEHEELNRSVELREILGEIDRNAHDGEISNDKITEFNQALKGLEGRVTSAEKLQMLGEIRKRFADYTRRFENYRAPRWARRRIEERQAYEDALASVIAFIDYDESSVYQVAETLRSEQRHSIKMALGFLSIFVFIVIAAALKIITVVTGPLSSLVRLLDQIHVGSEDISSGELASFSPRIPELARVAASFEQLLQRLRGYRALNVRRLLFEKRRADVIAASIADGIFLLRDDELLYVNPVGERILGLPSGSYVKGIKLSSLSDGKGESSGGAGRALITALNQAIPVEFVLQLEDRKHYYLLQSYPVSGELIEQVEHSVDSSIDRLMDRWQPNQLVLAQDVTYVRESQEAKSHFLGTLSHEVKTPVTSLTMATRLLKRSIDQIPDARHRALIETCAEDVDRLRGLLDDLLSVSGFDTLTQRLKIQDVDIGKLVRQSVQYFQTQAGERKVDLTLAVETQGQKVVVPMDATKISWALSNLMTNAIRHTPKGGKVHVSVESFEDSVDVKIRDMGPGIDRARQEKIFDKFSQRYDLRVARSGSTGTGLAIAREIVVAHGGRIWVTSSPGKGAEFGIKLPLKRGGLGVQPLATQVTATPDSASPAIVKSHS